MPAARVDVQIAKNTGGSDIGGVGSLEPADKSQVYSRNTLGNPIAHNYYAPFYGTYIPSTSRPGLSSGIDGPAQGNNFRGFLVDGFYPYWNFAEVLRTEIARPTQCLRRKDEAPAYRLTPAGAQNVVVYTDEHGEAQVEYNPGTGAYYDAVGAIKNANGGCDLEDVDVLGTVEHHGHRALPVPARQRYGEAVGTADQGGAVAVHQDPGQSTRRARARRTRTRGSSWRRQSTWTAGRS